MNVRQEMADIKLFQLGRQIIEQLLRHQHQAYYVGGCVRDLLLKRDIHDVDLCTSATPEEIQRIFPRTIPTGIQHGTVTVLLERIPFEVTTFRAEAEYEGARRPKRVTFIDSLQEDLARRDFTINALAVDLDGKVYDYFQGRRHLEQKMIHTVGEASRRFEEDALRMLRAVRFAAELGFDLSDACQQGIRQQCPLLSHISVERLSSEFHKLLKGAYVDHGLACFCQFDFQHFHPFSLLADAFEQLSRYSLKPLTHQERWVFLLSLPVSAPHNRQRFIKCSALSREEKKRLSSQVRDQVRLYQVQRADDLTSEDLLQIGLDGAIQLLRINQWRTLGRIDQSELQQLAQRWLQFPVRRRQDLALSGKRIAAYFQRQPGPWLEKALQLAFLAVAEQKIRNEENEILQYLNEHLEREERE